MNINDMRAALEWLEQMPRTHKNRDRVDRVVEHLEMEVDRRLARSTELRMVRERGGSRQQVRDRLRAAGLFPGHPR